MENQEVNPIPQTPVTPTPATPGMQKMMPGAIMYMVFGIVGVILWIYFFIPVAGIILTIVSLVFAILAFIKSKKMKAELAANPNLYKKASATFVKVAGITGLIGLILSAVFFVVSIIMTIALAGEMMF